VNTYGDLGSSSTIIKRFQSFTSGGGKLSSAAFKLYKVGTPTGSVVAKIYAHTGTYGTSSKPTGSELAVSDAVDISTITTSTSGQEYTFTFSGANKIDLTAATKYCVSIELVVGYTTDNSNNIRVMGNSDNASHSGNLGYFLSGTWDVIGQDFYFKVNTVPTTTDSIKIRVYVNPKI
jgi:hypothetical protein